MTTSVVILAAGRGDRMHSETNKVLLPLAGRPLICHTLDAFARLPEIDEIVLVIRRDERVRMQNVLKTRADLDVRLVVGGKARRDSSLAGVRSARGDLVLIHDGARPFPSEALIRRVLIASQATGAAIPILPMTDLLHRCLPSGNLDPANVSAGESAPVRAQTPQGFRRKLILPCLESAPSDLRDDATALLRAGRSVATVRGESTNLKVTQPTDLQLAEAIASAHS